MRLFLDCKWNGYGGPLISMAFAAENGDEWYEVVHYRNTRQWVTQNVIPVLGKKPMPYPKFVLSMREFLHRYQDVQIIADSPEHIARFCNALIVQPGVYIDTPKLTLEIAPVKIFSEVPNNALEDAKALRKALI